MKCNKCATIYNRTLRVNCPACGYVHKTKLWTAGYHNLTTVRIVKLESGK